MKTIRRYDYSPLLVSTTPSGGKRIDANIFRTGVQEYKMADGSIRRELRHPDEVFSPASLASWAGAPVTVDHPIDMVTPNNWKDVAIGHIDQPEPDGIFGRTQVHVNDAKAIERIGVDLIECSGGYTAECDPTPGEWEGQRYDGKQVNIRGNHLALGPRDWGRAGRMVGLRLDGLSDSVGESILTHPPEAVIMKVTIDGVEYEVGSASHISALTARDDRRTKEINDATERARKAEERALNAETAASPAAIAAKASERAHLIGLGRKKDPKFLEDKKDEAALDLSSILVRVLKMYAPKLSVEGKTPEQLAMMLEGILATVDPGAGETEATETPADAVEGTEAGGAANTEKKPIAADSIHAGRGTRVAPARNDAADEDTTIEGRMARMNRADAQRANLPEERA